MATAKKFRIPTVDEMEQADKDASSERPESLFKKNADTNVSLSSSTSLRPGLEKSTTITKIQAIKPNVPLQSKTSLQKADVTEGASEKTATTSKTPENSNSATTKSSDVPETVTAKSGPTNSLIVNTRQRGNPILKSVRNIPWEYGNIVPDYVMGQSNCALFLSLRYHQLHPNYIHERLKQLGKSYELRVMLVQVDVKEPHYLLKDLAKICILSDCTLILAFSAEEAGRYLETYKIFENKPPEAIMEKTEENFMAKFTDCLTRVKSVNKTDCATLLSHFGSLSSVIEASKEDLSLCPGFGPQKANRLFDIFHEPFLRANTRKRRLSGSSSNAAR